MLAANTRRILQDPHPGSGRGGAGAVEIDTAVGQLVNEAVAADDVLDICKLAGVDTPEISILSDEFLDSLAHKDKPNLQLGLLRRILNNRINTIWPAASLNRRHRALFGRSGRVCGARDRTPSGAVRPPPRILSAGE